MATTSPQMKTVMLNGIAVGEVASTGDMERDVAVMRQFLKDKGLYEEVTPFQATLNQAVAFANTSALLYERDLRRLPRKGVSVVPFVVNAAFSIELYLKALTQKHGQKPPKGHELVKLFERLPAAALSAIGEVTPRCAENRALREAPTLKAYLETLNSAFIEWRYCYELERTGIIHIEPTIFVMEVLHEACRLPPHQGAEV
ncbi:MAG: HEPN domain-containing protein [Pseudomonadota bacterium]